jgi:hypothetical protein
VDDVVPLSVKTVKVNPGDDGADSQVNLLGRKAPRSSISHEQDATVHEFDPDETSRDRAIEPGWLVHEALEQNQLESA